MQMNWMYGAKEPLLVLLFDSISHSLLLLWISFFMDIYSVYFGQLQKI